MDSKTARTRGPKAPRRVSSGDLSESDNEGDVVTEFNTQSASLPDMRVELHKIDDIMDQRTFERKFVAYDPKRIPLKQKDEELSSEKYSKWVLVLRRVFSNLNSLKKTRLDIKSPLIMDVLKEVVEEEQATLVTEGSIVWPNDKVFRYRREIEEAAIRRGDLAIRHVNVLLELIQVEYLKRIQLMEKMFPKGTATFDILREAFYAGDIVIQGNPENPRAYRVTRAAYHKGDLFRELRIGAEYIDFTGYEFVTTEKTFLILEFSGLKFLTECGVVPLKYHPQRQALSKYLLERGRKFASLRGKQHKVYAGPVDRVEVYRSRRAALPKLKFSEDESSEIRSDIIIDTITYNRLHSHDSVRVTNIQNELSNGELTEYHLMICTDRVPFFSLQDKQWHKGNVTNIKDKVFNERLFSQLVLPDPVKQLVSALVRNHTKGTGFDDFVKGKGKGLIILLHGPPGVGKTMTAEAVAEFTHRPLYIVTCGELGTTPEDLETSLERVLDTAQAFGAVLLLDEADVFLEQRSPQDLQRNALVSIFLRLLEYYKGMLFLTTNRVRTFDDAFHSRVHITLGYPNHDQTSREKIWRNFGTYMDGGIELREEEYEELSRWEINGRQIKNVLASAHALATDRGEDISMNDLRTVLQITNVLEHHG